ncbi:MAG TPA: PIN domain-containing protein [Allosphingosinicella sp.]|nr:PIN domain-containing protein [Allosphingosinicella sp.]
MKATALLDSNILIATLAEAHEHHPPSVALFSEAEAQPFAVAAHSYAEAFAILTHPAPGAPFRWTATEAWAGLESIAAVTRLVGLSHAQTFDAVRRYAAAGGVGPRLYDLLIGEAAVQAGIGCIVTWNVRHMAGLFAELEVVDPIQYASR